MNPDLVAAHVRERRRLDVQAITLVRSGTSEELVPWVWAAMTEHGHFWVVEEGGTLELFRAVARRTAPDDLLACHSAVEAARRFLMLHPRAPEPMSSAPTMVAPPVTTESTTGTVLEPTEACQVCGATFTRRRQSTRGPVNRPLCARCRHAERERLRYQQDPRYRARRLAYSAERYRRTQQAAGEG